MDNNLNRRQKLVARLARTNSLPVKGVVTRLFPGLFFRAFYSLPRYPSPLPATVILSFDCDSASDVEAIPGLLKTISPYGCKVAFACVGKQIERFPAEHRSIVQAGHEIINHTYSHPFNEELGQPLRFNALTREEQKNEIIKCHRVCKDLLGYEPAGFRIPHFGILYTEAIYDILPELGYTYSSSQLAVKAPGFGTPYLAKGKIVEFPVTTCPRHPFQAFDTYHAFRSRLTGHKSGSDFLGVFKSLVQLGKERGMLINLYFDPQDLARFTFTHFLEYLSAEKVAVKTYRDVVGLWSPQ